MAGAILRVLALAPHHARVHLAVLRDGHQNAEPCGDNGGKHAEAEREGERGVRQHDPDEGSALLGWEGGEGHVACERTRRKYGGHENMSQREAKEGGTKSEPASQKGGKGFAQKNDLVSRQGAGRQK